MHKISRHHHFIVDDIPVSDRVARVEARLVDTLIHSEVADERRDSSLAFELKHSAGVVQCGRILAQKRGLDLEISAVGALLHDIYVIKTGSYRDHARRGEEYGREILRAVGGFSHAETERIVEIIVNHSDKHLISPNPYVEFGKDADIL